MSTSTLLEDTQYFSTLPDSGSINPCTCLHFLHQEGCEHNLFSDLLCLAFGPWVEISHTCAERTLCNPESSSNAIQSENYKFLGFESKNNLYQHVIHGMKSLTYSRQDRNLLGIFGGRQIIFHDIRIASNNKLDTRVRTKTGPLDFSHSRKSNVFVMPDWIRDMNISWKSANEVQAIVGLAHNLIEFWNLPLFDERRRINVLPQPVRFQRVFCDVRCVCYSMSFCNLLEPLNDKTQLSTAVGTVSNKILVWKSSLCSKAEKHCETQIDYVSPQYQLTGHDGPITRLCWSSYDELLCSSSEDRSVRLWQMNSDPYCKWIGWGHTARIWDVQFLIGDKGVVSSGEDGCIMVWDINDGSILYNIASHAASIWKVARHHTRPIIVAGGNDGSAKLWRIPKLFCSVKESTVTRTNNIFFIPFDDPSCQNKKFCKPPSQVLCGIKVLFLNGRPTILTATRAGSVFSFDISSKSWNVHRKWIKNQSESNNCINGLKVLVGECIAAYEPCSVISIGCSGGEIVISTLRESCNEPLYFHTDKDFRGVKGIEWISSNSYANLLASHIKGFISILGFSRDTLTSYAQTETTHDFKPEYTRVLQMHTVGVSISFSYDILSESLFVGDTRGNMCYFKGPFDSRKSEHLSFTDKIEKAHDREHVTSISPLIGSIFYSVGVNGCIVEYNIDHEKCKLRKLLVYPVQSFASLSNIWLQGETNSLIIGGFYGSQFKLFDFSSKRLLMNVPCSGRNQRLFDVMLQPRSVICVSKEKSGLHQLQIHSDSFDATHDYSKLAPFYANNIIGEISHGDSTYAVCVVPSSGTKGRFSVVTGSNDCTINHTSYDIKNEKVHTCSHSASLPSHESCVRALCRSSSKGSCTQLLVCAGGKLEMRFYLLTEKEDGRFSFSFHSSLKANRMANIDQRINGVSAVPITTSHHLVVAGDSDGSLYALTINVDRTYSKPLLPHTCCFGLEQRPILCVKVLKVFGTYVAIVGNTAGEVRVWCITCNFTSDETQYQIASQLLTSYSAHQIGTNGIDASFVVDKHMASAEITITSCGDDQVISIGTLKVKPWEKSSSYLSMSKFNVIKMVHSSSSALKSIKIVKSLSTIPFQYDLFSIGYDQKLMVWRYKSCPIQDDPTVHDRDQGYSLRHISTIPIEISDISSLDCTVLQATNHMICTIVGQGMQVLLIKPNHITS